MQVYPLLPILWYNWRNQSIGRIKANLNLRGVMHVVQFPWEQPWQQQRRVHTGLHKHFILILKIWEKVCPG